VSGDLLPKQISSKPALLATWRVFVRGHTTIVVMLCKCKNVGISIIAIVVSLLRFQIDTAEPPDAMIFPLASLNPVHLSRTASTIFDGASA
jgi:hypothetical protein